MVDISIAAGLLAFLPVVLLLGCFLAILGRRREERAALDV